MLRSLLFTPADRLPAVAKALSLRALDACVIDLEDAVSFKAKETSRAGLSSFLSSQPEKKKQHYPKLFVRVNCPTTSPFGLSDLALIAQHANKIDGLVFPKVESTKVLSLAASAGPAIYCMIESARGGRAGTRRSVQLENGNGRKWL